MRDIVYKTDKFKVALNTISKEYYAYNVSHWNTVTVDIQITDNFIFYDTLKLLRFTYKNHVCLSSLSGFKFTMSNGKFLEMLLSGKYTSLDHDGKLLFTGRFSFRKFGGPVYLYPLDI